MWADLVAAFMLLTRLPVTRLPVARLQHLDDRYDPARAVWAYPLVGIVVGGIGGAAYAVGWEAGLPPVLAAVWTVAALLLTTGALHEDGAADTADGLGGGTRERRLEIMRDSRIGAFGALALLLALFARIAALTLLARPGPVALALIVAGALGRVAMVIVLATLTPARSDGLAAALRPGPTGVSVACAVAGAVTLLLPFRLSLGMLLAAGGCAALMRQLAREKFGGHTGDILGATEVLTECVVLTLLAGGR